MAASEPMQVATSPLLEIKVIGEKSFFKIHKIGGPNGQCPSFSEDGVEMSTKLLGFIRATKKIMKD